MAPKDKPIFSGTYSRDMWKAVNAIPSEKVKDALYFVCCRLQELEARIMQQSGKSEVQK
jgi:hypothetical protein